VELDLWCSLALEDIWGRWFQERFDSFSTVKPSQGKKLQSAGGWQRHREIPVFRTADERSMKKFAGPGQRSV
jgi:hypothetical protein